MTVCRCWAGRVSLCVCSSIIYPLSRLPAGQFLPTSRSSSLLSAGGVLWSAVGGNHSSSFLWSDSETARLDVSFYRIWSRARPVSVALRAPMNTLTRPHSDATSSLTDEAHTAGSRPIRAASSDADWKSHIVKLYGDSFFFGDRCSSCIVVKKKILHVFRNQMFYKSGCECSVETFRIQREVKVRCMNVLLFHTQNDLIDEAMKLPQLITYNKTIMFLHFK